MVRGFRRHQSEGVKGIRLCYVGVKGSRGEGNVGDEEEKQHK